MISAEQAREMGTRELAHEVIEALGNETSRVESTADLLECAIAQARVELAVVQHVLEEFDRDSKHPAIGDAASLLRGIRARLSLAASGCRTIDRILNDKPWEPVG